MIPDPMLTSLDLASNTSNASDEGEPAWRQVARECERRETTRRQGVALIRLLRSQGSSPDEQKQKRFIDLVESLPSHDPALDHVAVDGRSPLTTAAAEGSLDQVQRLLKAGASVHTQDRNGWTALHHAVHRLDEGIVRVLLTAGADARARVPQGVHPNARTALHVLVARASGFSPNADVPDVAIAAMLVRAGCNPGQSDAKGHPPLYHLTRQASPTRRGLMGLLETYALAHMEELNVRDGTPRAGPSRPRL